MVQDGEVRGCCVGACKKTLRPVSHYFCSCCWLPSCSMPTCSAGFASLRRLFSHLICSRSFLIPAGSYRLNAQSARAPLLSLSVGSILPSLVWICSDLPPSCFRTTRAFGAKLASSPSSRFLHFSHPVCVSRSAPCLQEVDLRDVGLLQYELPIGGKHSIHYK